MRGITRIGLVGKFALLSILPILLLGVALDLHLSSQIRNESLANARNLAQAAARLGVQPHVSAHELAVGLPPAGIDRVNRALRDERLADRVVRLKVWNRAGRVVYSDDRSLIGHRFPVSDELGAALAGRVASEISNLNQAEQRDDRRFGRLLEVYVPLSFAGEQRPNGAFELYLPYGPIGAHVAAQTRDLAIYLVAGLALLWALLLRIAISASGRLRDQAAQLARQADQNHYQATRDTLTGLPNRNLFRDRAGQAIRRARREQQRTAVLLVDLDRFKEVNDTLGHRIGDLLLQQVGERLAGALRASDTVARLGGDEFAVLLPDVAGPEAAFGVAEALRAALSESFTLEGVPVHAVGSAGVALYPDHGADADTLIQRADVAMYLAKESPKGAALYDPSRDINSVDRLALLAELRGAIETDELELYYQPKVDPAGRLIEGVEALLRWNHPSRGMVPPNEFIPVAEQTDLMPALTSWVLKSALTQASRWRERGLDLSVAVNVSATSLADSQLVQDVAEQLARTRMPPERLTVEITESAVMTDPIRAGELLCDLSKLGVKLAIDDFGAGHSSLAYLKRLPVNELKIDRSFVRDVATDGDNAVIVRSTIDLARNLGLRVVAEGVEDQRGLDYLEQGACDLVQGYAISRPLPPTKLELWLAESERSRVYTVAPADRAATPRPELATESLVAAPPFAP